MKNLTKAQLKIIYLVLILIVAFILFLFIIFFPQRRKLSEIKAEIARTDAQINEITSLSQGKDLAQVVRNIDKELDKAVELLPAKEELIIKYLSKNARKLEIDVKNMNLAEKKQLKDKVQGYVIEELPIVMSLSCGYKALGEYLNILKNDNVLLVKVKQLSIRSQKRPVLEVNMQISVFMAEQE